MADKLGIDFALIHRKRDRKATDAPERMEILVGDVKDKVRRSNIFRAQLTLPLGCHSCR